MASVHASQLTIEREYVLRNPTSQRLFDRQCAIVPGGATHMARAIDPFPLFIESNRGARKRDVDGHEYVDYWGGHGALLLGHAHPAVVDAVRRQAEDGFHAGGETALGLEWAELVGQLVPSAESVRFVASGGEATLLAIRVARAFTGRARILKFQGAFHGWHDVAMVGWLPPFDVPSSTGVPDEVAATAVGVPFADLDAVERALVRDPGVAAILLEPGGLYDDTVPSDAAFLRGLRELATRRDVLLIFDEVITGFRYARGGVQEAFGVLPDLTALGKIMGGGLPVGAVVGRRDVMDVLAWRSDPERARFQMVPHPGTWNANPAVAAAGVATLRLVRDTDVVERAARQARRLIDGCNAVFEDARVDAFAYGRASMVRTCLGQPPALLVGDTANRAADVEQLLDGWGSLMPVLRKAMLLEGVDLMRKDGFVSAVHEDQDIDRTVASLERAVARMRREGHL